MKKVQTGVARQAAPSTAWADQLAARCHPPVGTPAPAASDEVLDAVAALWAVFDETTREANAALDRVGSADHIAVERSATEGIYRLVGSVDTYREIRISLTISISQGRRFGGVSITTSQTRMYIYMEPVRVGEQMRWRIGEPGPELTPALVHDLFLSVFADEPLATQRLSPVSGVDLFQAPWN